MTSRISVLSLIGLAACSASPPPADDLVEVAACSRQFCGGNSPEVGHYGLHELNIDHQPNTEGFVIMGASKGTTYYDVVVARSQLIAWHPTDRLEGSDLVGLTIWVDRYGEQFGLRVSGVSVKYDVFGEPIESYVLAWSPVVANPLEKIVEGGHTGEPPVLGKESTPVCPARTWDASQHEWDEGTLLAPYESVLFEGDRIDGYTRTVDPTPDERWFNIGCATHTLAKLRLTRSTLFTSSFDWARVQATLKMLSGDYCGTGESFTVAGQPIVWQNKAGMSYWGNPRELEARWNENGAYCLNEPRLAWSGMDPLVERKIARECSRPPTCPTTDPYAPDRKAVVTSSNY